MYCVKKMTDDLYWVGASDRRLALFENVYPISRGVSYNSYLLLDEKTVLLDTADSSVSGIFFENVEHVLAGRPLDYLIVNHMEPDHCALMQDLVLRYPDVKIVCNKKTLAMIENFFTFDIQSRDRRRDGHAVYRPAHVRVRHGTHGALAGGDGVLRCDDEDALLRRRVRHLRRAERQPVRRRGKLPDRMARRRKTLLHQHCRQIRHAGTGTSEKGRDN